MTPFLQESVAHSEVLDEWPNIETICYILTSWAHLLPFSKENALTTTFSVLRSGSVRFFAPKMRNRGPQPVQDRPRYCGDRTGPPRTSLLRSTQPKKTSSDQFFGVNFVVPIKIIFISTIITLKIKQVI
jgi:hypothetical protein